MVFLEDFRLIYNELPSGATLVAVSKFKPAGDIMQLFREAGHLDFGENRAQELIQKAPVLPSDIRWHFIGHLQKNKVKSILPFVWMIHSVDSFRLLQEINREAENQSKVVKVLIQFYIAEEETKYGFSLDEVIRMIGDNGFKQLKNIEICGVMGMASFTSDLKKVRMEFRKLKEYFNLLKKDYFALSEAFREISMGMSGDYKIALEEGSTIIRIGSLIFGERT